MFTDNDFLSYFNELEMMEMTMRDVYKEALNDIKDPVIRKIFQKLYVQETEHKNIVEEVREILIKRIIPSDTNK